MNPWKLSKDRLVQSRKEDETFYALALEEFLSGHIRAGLMAKAIAASAGDEQKAKACYINLLASAIRDDSYLEERAREETLSEAQQMAKALSKAEKRHQIVPEPTTSPPSDREKRHMKKATKAGWYGVAVSLVGLVALLKNEGTAIGEAIFMALILSLILGFLFHILVRFTLALTDPQR